MGHSVHFVTFGSYTIDISLENATYTTDILDVRDNTTTEFNKSVNFYR